MIGFLLGIPSRLKLWAAAIIAAMAGAMALYAKGRADAKAKRAMQDMTDHKQTVQEVLHETPDTGPVDVIRSRMRDRAGKS
jgi:hydrogenase/urease accessory protein HupE